MNTSYTEFLSEFQSLESQYYAIPRAGLPFPTLYRSLLHKVEQYIASSHNSSQDTDILNHLRTAILSRVLNTKEKTDEGVGVDIEKFFPLLEDSIKRYEDRIVDVTLSDSGMNESTIRSIIVEMTKLTGETIPPVLEKIRHQIDEKIRSLSEDVIERVKRGETNTTAELTNKRNELAAQLVSKAVLGLMKTTSMGSVSASPFRILDHAEVDDTYLKYDKEELAKTTQTASSFASIYYKRERENLKIQLENPKINASRVEFARGIEQFTKTFDRIASFREILDRNVTSEAYLEQKTAVKKQIRDYQTILAHTREELERQPDKGSAIVKSAIENNDSLFDWITRVQAAIVAGELGIESIAPTDHFVSALAHRVVEVDDKITQIKEYEYRIKNSTLVESDPKAVVVPINGTENTFAKRYLTLDTNKQKLQNITKDFEVKMKTAIREYPDASIKSTLIYYIDRLQTAMSILIKAYDRIQDYRDHKSFHDYIRAIAWTRITHTPTGEKVLNDLKFVIKSNLVLLEYEKAVAQFKVYVFPFASRYRGHFDISSYRTSKNIKDLINDAVKEIADLRQTFSRIDPTTGTIPVDIKFAPEVEAQNEISKLLRGEEITVEVDIRRDPHRVNAVKFNDIGLRFVMANASMQKELDKVLTRCEINMVHLGDSHYKCDHQVYIIDHDQMYLAHSATGRDGISGSANYGDQNDVVGLLRRIKPAFSPYATWRMQLERLDGSRIRGLSKFADEKIDLELVVRGSHIKLNSIACKSDDLGKHYKLDKRLEDDQGQIENHRRKRQVASHSTSEPVRPASNSANLFQSPINSAFNLLGGVLGYVTNYNPIKLDIQSIFGQLSQFNAHGSPKHFNNPAATGVKFGIYESLTLADFLIRWVTKTKASFNSMEEPMNPSETKAKALNIIEEFERICTELREQFNLAIDSLEFDPIALMVALEKEIVNHDYAKIRNILLDTIAINTYSNIPQFCYFVQGKVYEIFE